MSDEQQIEHLVGDALINEFERPPVLWQTIEYATLPDRMKAIIWVNLHSQPNEPDFIVASYGVSAVWSAGHGYWWLAPRGEAVKREHVTHYVPGENRPQP